MGFIAFSTMGGNRTVNHTVSAYCKYFLSVTFGAVTMALAMVVWTMPLSMQVFKHLLQVMQTGQNAYLSL